ncbi:MAG: alpha-mannosidase [Clostridia bacterium]|nr:alpha-mannosidase [Clostridia bacterium]
MDNKIYLIGSAHLDPVWLWRWQEGCGEVLQTFRSALDRLNEYDDLIFTCSSAAYYKWVEEIEPEMFEEIRQRVSEGRWVIVNGWWVQPDCNMPSGESFARQALYSQLYYKEKFGKICTTGYNVDSFGHNANIPQLLKLSGMDSYVFMRPMINENAEVPDIFIWEGIDSTRIPAFKIPLSYTATGSKQIDMVLEKAEENVKKLDLGVMLFFGVGNHGGGPTKGDIEYMRSLNESGEHCEMVYSSPDEYFKLLKNSGVDLPVWKDDLQHHASGCYSVTSHIKQLNRKCENALFVSESFSTVAGHIAGMNRKTDLIKEAWRDVCFNQFHDILCGCSIMEAYEDAQNLAGHALTICENISNEAFQRIARRVDTWLDGVSDPICEVRNQEHFEKFERPVVVFNPLPYPVKVPVTTYNASRWVKNSAGEYVASQNVRASRSNDSSADTCFLADLPALGYETFWLKFDKKMIVPDRQGYSEMVVRELADAVSMDNGRIKVVISKENGGIVTFFVGKDHYDFGSKDRPMAIPTLIDDSETDTWAHNVFKFQKIKGQMELESLKIVEAGSVRGVVRARFKFGESLFVQDYILAIEQDVLRVKCKAVWKEPLTMLKVSFPTEGENHKNVYEIPSGFIQRPANGEEEPAQRWGAVSYFKDGEPYTLAVLNDSKYSYDCQDNDFRLTLLRNVIFADHYSDRAYAEFDYTDEGVHRFEYAIHCSAGEADTALLTKEAAAFNVRPVAVPMSYHKGVLPQRNSFLEVSAQNVALSALKFCEDGSDDVIIRLYETAGKDSDVSVSYAPADISFDFHIGKNEIKTYRCNSGAVVETDFLEGSE